MKDNKLYPVLAAIRLLPAGDEEHNIIPFVKPEIALFSMTPYGVMPIETLDVDEDIVASTTILFAAYAALEAWMAETGRVVFLANALPPYATELRFFYLNGAGADEEDRAAKFWERAFVAACVSNDRKKAFIRSLQNGDWFNAALKADVCPACNDAKTGEVCRLCYAIFNPWPPEYINLVSPEKSNA